MIQRNEIVDLLALCAVFDQRTAGPEDVSGWGAVAIAHGWDAAAARRVVIDYYGSGGDKPRLNPAKITDRLAEIRKAAAETFELPDVPPELPIGQTWPEYLRARRDEHVAGLLARWADSGEEPRALPTGPTVVSTIGQLVRSAPEHVRGDLDEAARRIAGRRT